MMRDPDNRLYVWIITVVTDALIKHGVAVTYVFD